MTYTRRRCRVHLIAAARSGHGRRAKIGPAHRGQLDGRDPATAEFAVAAGEQWAGALAIIRTMIKRRARTGTTLFEKRDAVRPSLQSKAG